MTRYLIEVPNSAFNRVVDVDDPDAAIAKFWSDLEHGQIPSETEVFELEQSENTWLKSSRALYAPQKIISIVAKQNRVDEWDLCNFID